LGEVVKLNSVEFFKFITDSINSSGMSDSEIGSNADLGRVAIWKIRNNKTKTIRRDTLQRLTNTLGLNYKIEGESIAFGDMDTSKPIGGGNMADTTADKVIDHLMVENRRANERIVEMKGIVDDLKEDLQFKEDLLTKNNVIKPNLDQARMQCLINVQEGGIFLDITSLWSKFLGYEPYELLGEPYKKIIHESEHEKVRESETDLRDMTKKLPWKFVNKSGDLLYVEAYGKFITTATHALSVVDIRQISENEYNDANAENYFTEGVKGQS